MKINAWSISDIGLTRKSNQDSVGHFPDLSLFIVADGMGGHADGDVASRMAVDVIHGCFTDGVSSGGRSVELERLIEAVELANQRIYEHGRRSPGQPLGRSLGTTVVVLNLNMEKHLASWVHVGDSRLYRFRDEQLELLTADHTMVGQEYWNKESVPTTLPHSNQLMQALGLYEQVDMSPATAALQSNDLFLLCSDGVSGQLQAAVIENELGATNDLQQMGEALIRLSLEAGGRDNASAVLVRVVED